MGDEPALLAAILAHPDEDTPRLMYADWLQENGRPERAEFIRLQCAPVRDDASEERLHALEERNRARWLARLPTFPPARWEFRRGFPESVFTWGKVFLERYDAFARTPWLRFLSLDDLDNSAVRDFVSRDWRPQWVELELMEDPKAAVFVYDYDSTPAVKAVARCPQVRQLRSLRLSLFHITAEGVEELASSPHLESLERLHLDDPGDDRFAPLRERFGERLIVG